jgi:formate dehydrogenase alpha subunit
MALKPGTNPDVEAATIELSIDGKTVTAKDGISLYDVISMTGKIIPAMCSPSIRSAPAACAS